MSREPSTKCPQPQRREREACLTFFSTDTSANSSARDVQGIETVHLLAHCVQEAETGLEALIKRRKLIHDSMTKMLLFRRNQIFRRGFSSFEVERWRFRSGNNAVLAEQKPQKYINWKVVEIMESSKSD